MKAKQLLSEIIEKAEERDLAELLKATLSIRLDRLQQDQDRIAREIAATKAQLQELAGAPEPPSQQPIPRQPRQSHKPRSGPRVSDIVRQTLHDAGGPLPLTAITKAVAKAIGKPLTTSLRSYVSQLVLREPTIKRLSRGLYAVTTV